jgi:hypothetical protein
MTLLAPEAALTAGLLTGLSVLALYFLKLRRRPVRVSSTVLWVQSAADLQVNVPLRWLRLSALLFLQLLAAALLSLALGRPATDAGAAGARQVILVIDRSASMSASDGVPPPGQERATRLDQAKREATRLVEDLSRTGSAPVALVTFAAEAEVVLGLTGDRRLVRDEIAALTETDQPGDLSRAMRVVSSLVSGAGGGEESGQPPALVILLSDGQSGEGQTESVGDAEFRFVRVGPASGAGQRANNGIVGLAATRDAQDPSLVRVFARLAGSVGEASPVTVSLAVNGEVVARRSVTVPAWTGSGEIASASVSAEFRAVGGTIVTAALPGGDLLAADDAASVVVAPAVRPRVLLVQPVKPEETAGITPETLLQDVLSELPLERFERVTETQYAGFKTEDVASGFDLVIFDRVTPATLPQTATLSFGAGLPVPGLELLPDRTQGGSYVISWRRGSPVLRDVALDALYVEGVRPFAASGDEGGIRLEDLAQGEPGSLLRAAEVGGRRRLVAAFELVRSNWPLQPSFTIFLTTAVDWLSGRAVESAAVAFSTGAAVEVIVPGEASRVTFEGPATFDAPVEPGTARRRVAVGPLPRAGVYTVSAGGLVTEPSVVAVNLANEVETSLVTRDVVMVAGRSVESGGAGAGPRELWPWFVLAAALVLLIEWALFSVLGRS